MYANKVQLRNEFFEAFGMSYFTMSNFGKYIKSKEMRTDDVDLLCVQDMMASDSISSFWSRNTKTQGLHADLMAAIGTFPPFPIGLGGGLVIPGSEDAQMSPPPPAPQQLYMRPPTMERRSLSPHLKDIRDYLKVT